MENLGWVNAPGKADNVSKAMCLAIYIYIIYIFHFSNLSILVLLWYVTMYVTMYKHV